MAGRPVSLPASNDIRLREWRERRKLTQSALGKQVGWSKSKVSRVESGEMLVKMDQIVRLARVLGIEPAQLLVAHEMPADDLDALIGIARKITPEDRRRLLRIAQQFLDTD